MKNLSIVMVTRNDGYGKDLLHRLNTSINSIIQLAGNQENLSVELIVVEWNPPANRKGIDDVINIQCNFDKTDIRVVTVPQKIHNKLPNSDKLPFFEYVGKNVGIRRAKYENILSTNSDVVFNKELVHFLARENIDKNDFYRIGRYDVSGKTPALNNIQEVISYCDKNTYRVSTPNGFRVTDRKRKLFEETKKIFSYLNEPTKILKRIKKRLRKVEENSNSTDERLKGLFLMTSGDFLLMKREAWDAIGGYRERGTNLHIDSLACIEALAIGMNQRIIDGQAKLYHPEHDRSERDNRPKESVGHFIRESRKILDGQKKVGNNSWGLPSYNFRERKLK